MSEADFSERPSGAAFPTTSLRGQPCHLWAAVLAPLSKATTSASFSLEAAVGFSLARCPHLGDEQDALQEHEVLVILIHGLLIDKVPGLQIRVIWEQQRAPGFRTRCSRHRGTLAHTVHTHPRATVPPVCPELWTSQEQ